MSTSRPIVETYQTKPSDFTPTPEHEEAYARVLLSEKETDDPSMQDAIAEAKASITDRCRELHAECKQLRQRSAYSCAGWCWHARIVDARTNEVLFDSPIAYVNRDLADRHGQRLIARWRKTGSWTKRLGVQASVK